VTGFGSNTWYSRGSLASPPARTRSHKRDGLLISQQIWLSVCEAFVAHVPVWQCPSVEAVADAGILQYEGRSIVNPTTYVRRCTGYSTVNVMWVFHWLVHDLVRLDVFCKLVRSIYCVRRGISLVSVEPRGSHV
jgi:hypothetical protein